MNGEKDGLFVHDIPVGEGRLLRLECPRDLGIGGQLWTTGLQLVRNMSTSPIYTRLLRGKRVLDLGAGTGLAGLAAAITCSPKEVVLSDLATHLTVLRRNAEINASLLPLPEATALRVAEFAWGTDCAHLNPPFDVILATDVAYFEELHAPFIKALKATMDAGSLAILGVTRTDTGPSFFDKLEKAGFEYYQVGPQSAEDNEFSGHFSLFTVFLRRPWDGREPPLAG